MLTAKITNRIIRQCTTLFVVDSEEEFISLIQKKKKKTLHQRSTTQFSPLYVTQTPGSDFLMTQSFNCGFSLSKHKYLGVAMTVKNKVQCPANTF